MKGAAVGKRIRGDVQHAHHGRGRAVPIATTGKPATGRKRPLRRGLDVVAIMRWLCAVRRAGESRQRAPRGNARPGRALIGDFGRQLAGPLDQLLDRLFSEGSTPHQFYAWVLASFMLCASRAGFTQAQFRGTVVDSGGADQPDLGLAHAGNSHGGRRSSPHSSQLLFADPGLRRQSLAPLSRAGWPRAALPQCGCQAISVLRPSGAGQAIDRGEGDMSMVLDMPSDSMARGKL